MQTSDIAKENLQKLKALFPECITEAKNSEGETEYVIDADILSQLLNTRVVSDKDEKYEFTWPGKSQAIVTSNLSDSKTLRPQEEKSIDFYNTSNLYIEGDNLEALRILREDYLGSVKLIYIDPPYNTGGDFVYKDNFTQSASDYKDKSGLYDEDGNIISEDYGVNAISNGRFHTDWLNMMYPRLRIARDLLSDDGVILINIDENEITNLQKICTEIFGESNDLGTIIWDKRNPKGDSKGISYQHEYILAYAKDVIQLTSTCKIQRPKKNAEEIISKGRQFFSKVGIGYTLDQANVDFAKWINSQSTFSGGEKAYCKIDSKGKVYRGVSMAWPNKKEAPKEYFKPLIHPVTGKPCPVPARGWRNPPKTMQELEKKGMIIFGEDERTQPTRKYLLEENMYENIPSLIYYGGTDTALLKKMGIPFDTPKSLDIVKEHVLSFTDKDSIVMDFFSGCATTAHAVMLANAEDGGGRKFIMVQIPEKTSIDSEAYRMGFNNICEIGEKRIEQAGKLIKQEMPDIASTIDLGFRVLRVDDSNMKDVFYAPSEYQKQLDLFDSADNIKKDRTDEDLLFQVMPEMNIPLSAKIEKKQIDGKDVFFVDGHYMIASFAEGLTDEIIIEIAKMKPMYFVMADRCAATDSVISNFETIFKQYSKDTQTKII